MLIEEENKYGSRVVKDCGFVFNKRLDPEQEAINGDCSCLDTFFIIHVAALLSRVSMRAYSKLAKRGVSCYWLTCGSCPGAFGGIISPHTHPILRVLKHIGHAASVLLEARQQLPQADCQKPQSEPVKGHGGEFHGSRFDSGVIFFFPVYTRLISRCVFSSWRLRQRTGCLHSPADSLYMSKPHGASGSSECQLGAPMGAGDERERTNRRAGGE